MHTHDTKAVCRRCGKELIGAAYHLGGEARHPDTGRRLPSNYYGGFVCSRRCDENASLDQERSMPGGRHLTQISSPAAASLRANWPA